MPRIEPLPFRIGFPGEDVIDFKGVRSVSYRIEGLLSLVDDTLEFEWTATERTERVSVTGIGTIVDQSPIGRLEVPASLIAEARLRWGWWRLRLSFQARRLDAFEGMPNARPGALTLKVRRRFRKQAEALIAAIEQANVNTPLPSAGAKPELESGNVTRLDDGGDP